MSREALFRDALARLSAAGIDNPRREARLLMAAAGRPGGDPRPSWEGLPRPPIAEQQRAIEPSPADAGVGGAGHDDDFERRFRPLLLRRIAREPLAYILGRKEFWSLDFAVGPGALVPRPETETLIEAALRAFPDRGAPLRMLDLGCGSGCLIVTALTLYPNARGTALDISPMALAWTARNAEAHGVVARLSLVEGGFEAAEGRFDLVLSNPPYLSAGEAAGLQPELGFEPLSALESGPDGLGAYRDIAACLPALLLPSGVAILELGAGQGAAVRALCEGQGLEILALDPDLGGVPRALSARLNPSYSPGAKKLLE